MFAVIKTGGKQYLVNEGQTLHVEKLDLEPGSHVELDVLLVADGDKVELGAPTLAKKIKAEVLAHGRAKKVDVVHYKAKSRYSKRSGHRQPFTSVKIGKIA